ncbi:alpha/beta hydrolase [Xanthobacter sediminis]
MGSRFDPEILRQTRELFEPLWASSPSGGVQVETLAYGTDERHVADIYRGAGQGKPVVIFVPGGGFVGGSRTGYRALGESLAQDGYVAVIADYRLAPASTWPAGAEDVARLTDWVAAHAASYGGDARSLFVFGHSAGGTHVASALFDTRLRPACAEDVAGIILMSGLYRVGEDETRPNVLAYFGEDRTQFADRAPLAHARNAADNVLVMASEYDPLPFANSAWALASALTERHGKVPRFHVADGHNHVSAIFAVGTEHDSIGPVLQKFISIRSTAVDEPRRAAGA